MSYPKSPALTSLPSDNYSSSSGHSNVSSIEMERFSLFDNAKATVNGINNRAIQEFDPTSPDEKMLDNETSTSNVVKNHPTFRLTEFIPL